MMPHVFPFTHSGERAAHSHVGQELWDCDSKLWQVAETAQPGMQISEMQNSSLGPQAAIGMPMQQHGQPHWQQAMLPASYCGGPGTVLWVPCQNVAERAWPSQAFDPSCTEGMLYPQQAVEPVRQEEQQQQIAVEPAPAPAPIPTPSSESPQKDCSLQQTQKLTRAAAAQLLQSLKLEVPPSVKVLQKQLREQRELHYRQQTSDLARAEQLQHELRLIQEMQCQLIAQAEEVLNLQLRSMAEQHQREGGSQAPGVHRSNDWGAGPMGHKEQQLSGTKWSDFSEPPAGSLGPAHARSERRNFTEEAPVGRKVCASTQRPPPTYERAKPAQEGQKTRPQTGRVGRAPAQPPYQAPPHVAPPQAGHADTMKSQLQALQNEDPGTVFITRRINKLGFSSAEQLRCHFSRYGEVKCVYVSHSRVKSMRPDAYWRMRAASLGFVVMCDVEATSRILADGPNHLIGDVHIRVHTFHRHGCSPVDEEACSIGTGNDSEAHFTGEACSDSGVLLQGTDSAQYCPQEYEQDLPAAEDLADSDLMYSGSPFSSLARFSVQELYNALPERYED